MAKTTKNKQSQTRVQRKFARARKAESPFKNVKSEGGLLVPELLARVAVNDSQLPGMNPADYHLLPGERFGEVVSREYARLQRVWLRFKERRDSAPVDALDKGDFVWKNWVGPLLSVLGYDARPWKQPELIEGKERRLSHRLPDESLALHCVAWNQDLDARDPKKTYATISSPHSLVQEFLNIAPLFTWGLLTNGRALRLLRDNVSFSRAAYVEFDLEAIMDANAYSDFYLLYLLLHASRFVKRAETPSPAPQKQRSNLEQPPAPHRIHHARHAALALVALKHFHNLA